MSKDKKGNCFKLAKGLGSNASCNPNLQHRDLKSSIAIFLWHEETILFLKTSLPNDILGVHNIMISWPA